MVDVTVREPLIEETIERIGAVVDAAERTLERLPDTSPDHETVARLIVDLRRTQERLFETRSRTQEAIQASRRRIEASERTVRAVRAMLYSGMTSSRP